MRLPLQYLWHGFLAGKAAVPAHTHYSVSLNFGADPGETIFFAFKVSDPEGTGVLGGEVEGGGGVNQMLTNFLLDVAGNLDCNSVCYVITRREDKEQE
ncbi:myosin regulatory light chain 2B, cardiac muscle isoform-like isoform X1 [Anabas testudineus]|uniref:myosin regulatory light chain 2B, cardiac muscle isoform-like isoform X1 n=1 Tax=Anabas testudineus TaxID=64144 RepID=UPI000E464198|nr:myosin regulatory light chain 2B, cardiac muscle isoform-like isoform X1 [Anabas testudineus]